MKYIIKLTFITCVHRTEFIGCGTYIFQGDKYVVLTDFQGAKRYSTKKRAEAAYHKFFESCVNVSVDYEIVEVEE